MRVTEISLALRANAEALARALLPRGRLVHGREWMCRGKESPTGSAISVHIGDGPKRGVVGFWSGETRRGGDMLDLIEAVQGCTTKEAAEFGRQWLGNGDVKIKENSLDIKLKERELREERRRRLYGLWSETTALNGPSAYYLKHRGLDLSLVGEDIRSHRGLKHPEGGTFPALVCKVSDINGGLTGVWRIFCKPDGSGKAPVESPKMGLGEVRGGAVRIGGLWSEIGVAEGVETAVACRQLLGANPIPVWSCLSASGLIGFRPPQGVDSVRIFADSDPSKVRNEKYQQSPGMLAAERLVERLSMDGINVTIEAPPIGMDWLDVLRLSQEASHAEADAAHRQELDTSVPSF